MIRSRCPSFRSSLVATLAIAIARVAAAAGDPIELPRFPVCEPSAALPVPCSAHEKKRCIWVGDNEDEEHLFEYEVTDGGRLVESEHWKIALGGVEVGDVEALARDGDAVLVFGSHGRNSRCEAKKKRARIARIDPATGKAAVVAATKDRVEDQAGCEAWIALPDGASDAERRLRSKACRAIVAAEAENAEGGKCPGTALNVEGAVTAPDGAGKERIWLGLRAPLAGDEAILLRVARPPGDEKRIVFDGIATIDLRGQGIRELAWHDGALWGIAGSVPDSDDDAHLWRVPASALASGATITGVERVGAPLPATSEGLAIIDDGKRALVLVDGDVGDGSCATPARQLVRDL